MSVLYRAVLGIGACVLFGASHVTTADAITWNFGGEGGLQASLPAFTASGSPVTVTATAWNYRPPVENASPSFQAASLFQGAGGLGVCAGSEMTLSNPIDSCLLNQSGAYQVDNYGHDDYVLFVFSTPIDQLTVRIDPEVNATPGLGWDRDISYWVGNVDDLSSFNLEDKAYSYLTGLGFSSGYSDGTRSEDYRDVSIYAPTSVNVLLFGPKLGGEDGGLGPSASSDRFNITSISSVPEPSSMILLALGMVVIGLVSLRRNLVQG